MLSLKLRGVVIRRADVHQMMFDYVTVHADTVILDDEKPIGGIPANDDFSGRGDFPVFRVGSSGGNVRLVADCVNSVLQELSDCNRGLVVNRVAD